MVYTLNTDDVFHGRGKADRQEWLVDCVSALLEFPHRRIYGDRLVVLCYLVYLCGVMGRHAWAYLPVSIGEFHCEFLKQVWDRLAKADRQTSQG